MAAVARPARAITGPATAQVVELDMKLPPMTPTPWSVKMTPASVMRSPRPTSRALRMPATPYAKQPFAKAPANRAKITKDQS
jgi:hypothetical protein